MKGTTRLLVIVLVLLALAGCRGSSDSGSQTPRGTLTVELQKLGAVPVNVFLDGVFVKQFTAITAIGSGAHCGLDNAAAITFDLAIGLYEVFAQKTDGSLIWGPSDHNVLAGQCLSVLLL